MNILSPGLGGLGLVRSLTQMRFRIVRCKRVGNTSDEHPGEGSRPRPNLSFSEVVLQRLQRKRVKKNVSVVYPGDRSYDGKDGVH